MTNTRDIVRELPGYNKKQYHKSRAVWNTDFQSFNPPLAYKIQAQESKGGAGIVMICAAILGLIIAACLGVL